MPLIRPVSPADLDSLVRLAGEATFGLTTLTSEPFRLQQRIEQSESGEAPLLVMVDEETGGLIGTAGLFTHVGDADRAEPFYTYRLERTVHQSKTLGVLNKVDALHLTRIFDGPTEIGTLFLHPDVRGSGLGRVLSLSRFLLIARDPDRFDRQIIAEMRGVIDEKGRAPFWDAIGRHFFQVDFPIADILSSQDKRFIGELMPAHPIYVPLLPAEAQAVIGEVHPNTAPAKRLLESEGFEFAKMVDIFDGGPCLRCDRKAIRTIVESRRCELVEVHSDVAHGKIDSLVATAEGRLRIIGCRTQRDQGKLSLAKSDAAKLNAFPGATLIVAPIKGTAESFWNSESTSHHQDGPTT